MITSQIAKIQNGLIQFHGTKKNICSKLYGTTFEDFITQARTYRYNIMCSLVAHDRLQENKPDYEISISDRVIPNDATVKALK